MWDSRPFVENHLKRVNNKNFKHPMVAFDTETDGLYGPFTLYSYADNKEVYVSDGDPSVALSHADIVAMHGGQYDWRIAMREGWDMPKGIYLDTQAASFLVDENQRNGLKPTVENYIGVEGAKALGYNSDRYGRWKQGWSKDMSEADLRSYAAMDAKFTREIALRLWPKLDEQGLLMEWLKVDSPMSMIVAEMEDRGIAIDTEELEKQYYESQARVQDIEDSMRGLHPGGPWDCQREGCRDGVYHFKMGSVPKQRECRECGGTGMNLKAFTSAPQMQEILFDQLGLEPESYTDAGNPSTKEEDLIKLREQSNDPDVAGFVHRLLELREWNQLYSMFYKPYMEMGADVFHPHFKPWGTVTGRWSCEKPNLQQVPKVVRKVFVPRPGYKLLSVDYVQLELYLMAAMAGETKILEAYESNGDLHQRTADVAGLSRHGGKTVNFSLAYGLSRSSLASRLNIDESRAGEIIEAVVGGYDSLFSFFEQIKNDARQQGYVTTLFGRRRRLPNINAVNFAERGHAERQAVNSVIQGTAADLIKAVMIDCKINVPEALPLLQVHDEIDFEVPEEDAEEIKNAVVERFEGVVSGFGLYPRADAVLLDRWA